MKLSLVTLLSILGTKILAAPVHVVYVTTYTTLIVNLEGKPIFPTPTGATAEATSTVTNTPTTLKIVPSQPTNATPTTKATPTKATPTTPKIVTPTTKATPTTPKIVTPTTTAPTTAPTTPTTQTTAPTQSQSSGTFHGDGTYFNPALGACGHTNTDDDLIVAISSQRYTKQTIGNNPNNNPLCGQKLRVWYEGKSVDVTIVDSCPGCSENSLDLSPAAFERIADKDLGRIKLDWSFL